MQRFRVQKKQKPVLTAIKLTASLLADGIRAESFTPASCNDNLHKSGLGLLTSRLTRIRGDNFSLCTYEGIDSGYALPQLCQTGIINKMAKKKE